MLNKIKNKILHIIREKCGYYELEKISLEYQQICFNYCNQIEELKKKLNIEIVQHEELNFEYNILSAKHEAKILEYDILFAKNESKTLELDILDAQVKSFPNDYKKYLIQELEQILNIMRDKGVHPQDLIKRVINKAKRDIK